MGWLLLIGFLVLPALMLAVLHRKIQQIRQAPGGRWILITAMIWGFLWVGERAIVRFVGNGISDALHLGLFFLTAFFCFLVYGLVFWRAVYQERVRNLEKQVEEIGEEKRGEKE